MNRSVLSICKDTPFLHYIDNDQLIFNEGKFQKSLYDVRDVIGVHLSDEDALELYNQCCAFFHQSDELYYELTPSTDRKRNTRGSNSDTPQSAGRITRTW